MPAKDYFKSRREQFGENLKLRKEKLSQIKGGIQKRALILTFFVLLFGIPWLAQRLGIITIPPVIDNLLEIIFVASIALWSASVFVRLTVSRAFHYLEGEVEIEQHILLTKLYTWFVYLIAFAVILWRLGISTENIVIYLGFVTTGIALSISQLIFSFFVWLVILNKKPVRMGDVINVDGNIGVVTKIGTFFLTIESVVDPKETLKIPNKVLLDKPILNMGRDRMYQEIKLSITKVPKDLNQRIKVIRQYLSSELDGAESIKIGLDADGSKWYLKIKLVIRPEHEGKKSEILRTIYPLLKDILKKPD